MTNASVNIARAYLHHGAGRFALVAQAARIPAFDGGSSTRCSMLDTRAPYQPNSRRERAVRRNSPLSPAAHGNEREDKMTTGAWIAICIISFYAGGAFAWFILALCRAAAEGERMADEQAKRG